MLRNGPALVHTLRRSQGRGLKIRRCVLGTPASFKPLSTVCRPRLVTAVASALCRNCRPTRLERVTPLDGRNEMVFGPGGRRWRQASHDRRSALRDHGRWTNGGFALFVSDAWQDRRCTQLLADLGGRSGSCGPIALVDEVLRSNEATKAHACVARLDLTDSDARLARIRKDIVRSSTLPIQCRNHSLDRSRLESNFPPSSPETGNMRGEL